MKKGGQLFRYWSNERGKRNNRTPFSCSLRAANPAQCMHPNTWTHKCAYLYTFFFCTHPLLLLLLFCPHVHVGNNKQKGKHTALIWWQTDFWAALQTLKTSSLFIIVPMTYRWRGPWGGEGQRRWRQSYSAEVGVGGTRQRQRERRGELRPRETRRLRSWRSEMWLRKGADGGSWRMRPTWKRL